MQQVICAGIDAGSRTIKIVLYDGDGGRVLASSLADQGADQARLAAVLFDQTLRKAGLNQSLVQRIVATGYGRNSVGMAHTTVTEITCHAHGVRYHLPHAATVMDIGGEDSKLIRLDAGGRVRDFAMNDRCAAGTGRFLEIVARRLDVAVDRLGQMAAGSARPAQISSMCAVFAETEIIGLLAAGVPANDIAAGVQTAIAGRMAAMAGRKVESPVVLTGGVALVEGMGRALEKALDVPVRICPDPRMTGALGAAILACRQME